MPDTSDWVRTMNADPKNVVLRLLFADWCDENGLPGLAEFVRIRNGFFGPSGCEGFLYNCGESSPVAISELFSVNWLLRSGCGSCQRFARSEILRITACEHWPISRTVWHDFSPGSGWFWAEEDMPGTEFGTKPGG